MHGLRLQIYKLMGDAEFPRPVLQADTGDDESPWREAVETYNDVPLAIGELMSQMHHTGHMLAIAKLSASLVGRARTGRAMRPSVAQYLADGEAWEVHAWIKPGVDGTRSHHTQAWRAEYTLYRRLDGGALERLYTTACAARDTVRPPDALCNPGSYTVPCDGLHKWLPLGRRYVRHWLSLLHPDATLSDSIGDDALARRLPGLRVMLSRRKAAGREGYASAHVEFEAASPATYAKYKLSALIIGDTAMAWPKLPSIDNYTHPWEGQ